jgi:F-type H+-transporting ATPase subunit b
MRFITDPAVWTAIALLLFIVVLIILKVPGMLAKALDARAEGIRKEIEEARRLREEAQGLLDDYRRRSQEASREAEAIVAEARAEAQRAGEEARTDLANAIARRRKQAEEKIERAEEQAAQEIRAYAGAVSIGAAKRVIRAELDPPRAARLIDNAISALPERLRGR